MGEQIQRVRASSPCLAQTLVSDYLLSFLASADARENSEPVHAQLHLTSQSPDSLALCPRSG